MQIGIWRQGVYQGKAFIGSDGNIKADGPHPATVMQILLSYREEAKNPEDLLRVAIRRMHGFWYAQELAQ